MKKTLLFLLVICMSLVPIQLTSCSNDSENGSDLEYVMAKHKLVVGVTDFAPMDYLDESGNWVGFDAELATAFAKSLDMDIEFVEIAWDKKVFELNSKTIDCVWNGMTLDDETTSSMACSNPYCNNAQVIVIRKDAAQDYKTADDCKKLVFAVEGGSTGEKIAETNDFTYTQVDKQSTAVMEVAAGTSDAAIIDSLMAAAMVGDGTGYPDLTYTLALNDEKYGVGFRKGSDIVNSLNTFFETCKADGTLDKLAMKYGVQAALIK